MNYILSMTVANSLENLFDYFNCFFFREPILLYYSIKKLTSFAELCDDIKPLFSLGKLKDFKYIWMILIVLIKEEIEYKFFQYWHFINKLILLFLIACFSINNFDCSGLSRLDVFPMINLSKSALTYWLMIYIVLFFNLATCLIYHVLSFKCEFF